MFRATMCPSSGELTVSVRHWYFSLYGWLSGQQVRCFGPFSGALDCVYSLWYNVTSHQQTASSVLYTTSCKHSLVLLRMGEIIARSMSS